MIFPLKSYTQQIDLISLPWFDPIIVTQFPGSTFIRFTFTPRFTDVKVDYLEIQFKNADSTYSPQLTLCDASQQIFIDTNHCEIDMTVYKSATG